VPAQLGGPLAADGSGYLLYTGLGGVYDVRDTGVRRITTGTVVAVGTTKWITVDCDDQFRCSTVLVDQATLRRTTIGHAPPQPDYLPGTISPDGKYAAYVGNTGTSTESLHVIDLANFTDTELRVRPANVSFDTQPFVWAPSGHALFVSDNNETLELVDPATGSAHVVDPRLPRVVQLAVRVLS
jgi:hypothetical protein